MGESGSVSVNYATSDGTAKAGTNYTSTSGTLNFPDGQTTETFTIPIINDPVPVGSETVKLSLSTPMGGAALGTQSSSTLTITDVPGVLQFSAPTYSVRKDGAMATITVSRTLGDGGAVSVNYATSDGTAKAGTNYTNTSGTLNFPDGQTTETFTVPILNDPVPLGSETVNLSLSTPTSGATLGTQSSSTLTIADTPGTLQFRRHTYSVRKDGATATITVSRTLGDGGPSRSTTRHPTARRRRAPTIRTPPAH